MCSRHDNGAGWTIVSLACAVSAAWLIGCAEQPSGPSSQQTSQRRASAKPWFEECAAARGIDFRHVSGHRDRFLIPEIMGGGAALVDLDNDGDLDLYLVQSGSLYDDETGHTPGNQLYRNRGDGTFENITPGSGAEDRGYGMGVATGDFNNDGFTDLYITNLGPNVLLRNNGDGTFTDVTLAAGVGHEGFGASAAFVDVDADGYLDLFVVNYLLWSMATERECFSPSGQPDFCGPRSYEAPAPDVLYRNNGDGTFTDITAAAGIDQAFGNGLGVICGDFTGDGRVDIFVANDATPNQLWVNRGISAETGVVSFVDEAWTRGCAVDDDATPKAGMGVTAADLDRNSTLDLLVVNLHSEADSLHLNHGAYFIDATAMSGLSRISRPFTRFGVAFCDFDNDGVLDIFQANGAVERRLQPSSESDPYAERNTLMRGVAGESVRFEEVRPVGGTSELIVATSRAAAFGDIDNDGGIDIVVVNRDESAHLLRNIVQPRGNWITFSVLNEHGSDALGAMIRVTTDTSVTHIEGRSAFSYLAANDPRVHVGLGSASIVKDAVVTWPDGGDEQFGPFEANTIVTVRKGSGKAIAARE